MLCPFRDQLLSHPFGNLGEKKHKHPASVQFRYLHSILHFYCKYLAMSVRDQRCQMQVVSPQQANTALEAFKLTP